MSTLQRVLFFAATVVLTAGCGQHPSPPSTPTANTRPSDRTDTPAMNAPTPSSPSSAKPSDKEDLALPDAKLVKVDFKLNGVDLTIDAPEGAKVDKPESEFLAEVLFGKDSCLLISRGGKVAKETAWWKKGGGFTEAKRFLIEQPDTLLVESKERGDRRFVCLHEKELGGVKYTVGLARPGSGRTADSSTKEECLLALKCAKTLALKKPAPKPPEK